MRLWPLFANKLFHLQIAQPVNHPGPEQKRNQKRRKARDRRANRDVAKNVQRAEIWAQYIKEKVVEHFSPSPFVPLPLAPQLISKRRAYAPLQSPRGFSPCARHASLS